MTESPSPLHAGPFAASLGTVEVPRSSEVLAQRLEEHILTGEWPAGTPLPTERELAASTGLGRSSVREALRILEIRGLVRTRPGRYGGSVVARPSDALLERHIGLFARGRSVPLRALVEARQALEPMVAYLASRNRTAEDLAELHAIAERLDAAAPGDVAHFLEENVRWHAALARACHNDLLRAFAASISGLMLEASRIEHFASADVRLLVTHAHRRILAAIEAGDADAARRRAERDVQAYAQHLEAALAACAAPATPASMVVAIGAPGSPPPGGSEAASGDVPSSGARTGAAPAVPLTERRSTRGPHR
jgi:GntR family transcriptional repressor for pyruvate dehydrogenase complex